MLLAASHHPPSLLYVRAEHHGNTPLRLPPCDAQDEFGAHLRHYGGPSAALDSKPFPTARRVSSNQHPVQKQLLVLEETSRGSSGESGRTPDTCHHLIDLTLPPPVCSPLQPT